MSWVKTICYMLYIYIYTYTWCTHLSIYLSICLWQARLQRRPHPRNWISGLAGKSVGHSCRCLSSRGTAMGKHAKVNGKRRWKEEILTNHYSSFCRQSWSIEFGWILISLFPKLKISASKRENILILVIKEIGIFSPIIQIRHKPLNGPLKKPNAAGWRHPQTDINGCQNLSNIANFERWMIWMLITCAKRASECKTSWDAYLQLTAEATLESCSYEEIATLLRFHTQNRRKLSQAPV